MIIMFAEFEDYSQNEEKDPYGPVACFYGWLNKHLKHETES